MRLYFKKLFSGILYFLLGALIYGLLFNVLRLITNSLGEFHLIAFFGIPAFFVWIIAYRQRVTNANHWQEFLYERQQSPDAPFRLLLKLRGFATEVTACATIVGILGCVLVANVGTTEAIGFRLAAGVIVELLVTALYTAADALSWYLVMRNWCKRVAE